jgi:hypothetical protein
VAKKLELLITGNAKGAQKALGDLEKSAGKSGKKTESALSGVAGGLADIGVAALAWSSFTAFDESQRVAKQTEAVIASTGGAANVTAQSVSDLAGELSKKAGVDDELIQSGSNLLMTFTKVRNEVGKGNDVFDQATGLALDMSVAMGTDMKSASMTVGKALNDPIKGISALTRAGVQFTGQQKDQIRAMVESGDTLGAQKVILKELETQFGGSAEAQATSLGKAQVAVGNLAESVGGVLAPVMEKGADLASAGAEAFGELGAGTQQAVVAGAGLAYAAARWGPALLDAASSAKHAGGTIVAFGQLTAEAIRTRPEGVSRLAASFDVVSAAAPNATAKVSSLVSAMGGLGVAVPVVGGALAVGGLMLANWAQESANAKKNADSLRKAIEAGATPTEALNEKLARTLAGLEDGFSGIDTSTFQAQMRQSGVSVEEVSRLVTLSKDEWEDARREMQRAGGTHVLVAEKVDKMRGAMSDADSQTKTYEASVKALGLETEETGDAADGTAASVDVLASRTEAAKSAADRYAAAQQAATDSLKRFFDQSTSRLSATVAAEAALDELTESVKENGTSLDETDPKGRANIENFIGMKDAAVAAAVAVRESGGSNKEAADTLTGFTMKLAQSAEAAGFTEDEVKWMIATMKLTPKDIESRFHNNAPEQSGKVAGYVGTIGRVATYKKTTFDADISPALYKLGQLQQASKFSGSGSMWVLNKKPDGSAATGGRMAAGETFLVGEEGPELFTADEPGMVWSNQQTRAVLSGGGGSRSGVGMGGGNTTVIHIHVAGSVVAEEQLERIVRTYAIDRTRRTGKPWIPAA